MKKGTEPSCEDCIYFSSERNCKTCDEDWSEFVAKPELIKLEEETRNE